MQARARKAWGSVVALSLLLLFALVVVACKSTRGCDPGQACECAGGDECFLGCTGDGCVQRCHDIGVTCGTVCNDHCNTECFGTKECTSSCGDECAVTCHDVTSCAVLCGANCNYDCHNVSDCSVNAGPGSVVQCDTVTNCRVQCEGPCKVSCNNLSVCDVSCPKNGGAPTTCPDGTKACGPC